MCHQVSRFLEVHIFYVKYSWAFICLFGDPDLLCQLGFKLLEKYRTVCILKFPDKCVKFRAFTRLAANWPGSL